MNKINTQAFQIINPETLYHPKSNGYSHIAVVKPNMRIIHIGGQGGENKNGELSPFLTNRYNKSFIIFNRL